MILDNKKEWATDIFNNMDETLMHYVEWKEPITKSTYWMIAFMWSCWKCKQMYSDGAGHLVVI